MTIQLKTFVSLLRILLRYKDIEFNKKNVNFCFINLSKSTKQGKHKMYT